MKKLLIALFLLMPVALMAQEEAPVVSADTTEVPQHILFEGVELSGDIYAYAKTLQKQSYKLQQRDLNQLFFVFKGNVCGHPTQFKVSFSKKSKTVWRVIAQPHNVPADELVASLTETYGEPSEALGDSYKWLLPTGLVQLRIPEGYDPTLVVLDVQGAAIYKEEDNRN